MTCHSTRNNAVLPFWPIAMLIFVAVANAQSWVPLAPSGPLPGARVEPAAVFAPGSNRLIVFGGYTVHTSNPFPYLNDLWILTGANGTGTPAWQQVIPQGAAGSPPPRGATSSFYNSVTNRLVIFGGEDQFGTVFNDVWVLGGADGTAAPPAWVQQFPSSPPPPRIIPSAAYDAKTNRLIIFGGQPASSGSSFQYNDVWVLTNADGSETLPPAWIQLQPAGTLPVPRSHQISGYDPVTNKLIVFGGESRTTGLLNDTWVR
jgi:hypothetical protein